MSDSTPTPDQPPVPPQPPTPPQYQQPQYQQPPAGYPQQPPYAAGAPYTPDADKQLAMWAHIGGIVGFLPSLIIWLIGKDRGPRTNVEGKEALNWQITWIIVYIGGYIVLGILAFIPYIGVVFAFLMIIWWLLWVPNLIFSIIGGVRVNAGGSYRYPVNFRFIK